jgi:hypothetical protein
LNYLINSSGGDRGSGERPFRFADWLWSAEHKQRMRPWSQRWSPLGIAIFVVALCACSPDKPPSVAGKLSPALQSALQEMSALGARDNREQSFAYTLADNCDLHATKLLNGHPTKHMIFPLENTQFGRYDYAPGLGYAIQVENQSGGVDNVVFEAPTLELIQSMLLVLEKLKVACVTQSTG